ncbi:protein transport membrane glycoprotein [Grosmannia clavigera kw1407]|uniref:Protein transport membrane glycoprotein n=1 Tax=Grosmannia clavigera (strain kw1407 / UAMH 11150) TaxID=655863 RepID=F0XKJ3_GROCL|nr:protein transport membrane glycoprotein [Grosmannia clavigera kw1407]EFX01722.1 protein transport membrane glycoprotein [Grosmannia clavigera kw1407]
MASLEELQGRLAMLQESLDELHGLTERLGASATDEDVVADRAAEIVDGLRDARDEHELLQEDVLDLAVASGTVVDHDRARLKEGLARLDRELQAHHATFRQARLRARQALEKAQRREQLAMLEAYADPASDDGEDDEDERSDSDDDDDNDMSDPTHALHRRSTAARSARKSKPPSAAAAAAADVTAALRQTHARIAGEVARSDFAAQTLAESSRALADLGERYGGSRADGDIAASLRSARHLARGLMAAHKSDTWYLQTALYLVAATAAWLLFRRLLYGPLWLLVWWPARSAWTASVAAVGLGVRVGSVAVAQAQGPDSGSSSSSSIITNAVTSLGSTAVAHSTPAAATPSDSLVEQVGQIINDSISQQQLHQEQQQQQQQQQPAEPAQPNPMKRMWEEDVETAKYDEQNKDNRPKDEL